MIFESNDQPLFNGDDLVLRPSLSGFSSGGEYLESLGEYLSVDLNTLTFGREIVYADGADAVVVVDSSSVVMMASQTGSMVSMAETEIFLGAGDYVLSSDDVVSIWIDLEAPPKSIDLTDVSSEIEIVLFSEPGQGSISASVSDSHNLVINDSDISIPLSLGAETSLRVTSPWSSDPQTSIYTPPGYAVVEPTEVINAEWDDGSASDATVAAVAEPMFSDGPDDGPNAIFPEIGYDDDFLMGTVSETESLSSFHEIEPNLLSFEDLDARVFDVQLRSDPLSVVYGEPDHPSPEPTSSPTSPENFEPILPEVDAIFSDLTPTEMIWEDPDDFIV